MGIFVTAFTEAGGNLAVGIAEMRVNGMGCWSWCVHVLGSVLAMGGVLPCDICGLYVCERKDEVGLISNTRARQAAACGQRTLSFSRFRVQFSEAVSSMRAEAIVLVGTEGEGRLGDIGGRWYSHVSSFGSHEKKALSGECLMRW